MPNRLNKVRPVQPKGGLPHAINDPNVAGNFDDVMRQVRELQDYTPEIYGAEHLWKVHPTNANAFELSFSWKPNRVVLSVKVQIDYFLSDSPVSETAVFTKKKGKYVSDKQWTGYEQDFTVTLIPYSKAEVDNNTGQPLTELAPEIIDDRKVELQFDGALDVVVDIDPRLDEDNGTLHLLPNMADFTKSIRYVVRTDREPTTAETAAGTVSTADKITIYSFGDKKERVYIGVLPYTDTAGTKDQGSLVTLNYEFDPGNNIPQLSWMPAVPSGTGKEKVRLILTDDGDQVAMYYRTYTKGATTLPAFTRVPATGFQSDPLVQNVEVSKPAEGAANVVIEAYGIDDAENQTARNLILEVDGNARPSGDFKVRVGTDGAVYVTPNSTDNDSGSWRFRASLSAYSDPAFSDTATDEFKGNTFGSEVALGSAFNTKGGKTIFISGFFFRTTSTTASAQNSSLRSPVARASSGGPKGEGLQVQPYLDAKGNVKVNVNALTHLSFKYAHASGASPSFPTSPTSAAINLSSGQYTLDPAVKLEPGHTYMISVWFYTETAAGGVQSERVTGQAKFDAAALQPYLSQPRWNSLSRTSDFGVFVNDPLGKGGTLKVWSNKGGDTTPDPAGTPDGEISLTSSNVQVDATWAATNGTYPLNDIPYAQNREKEIYLEFITSDSRGTGKVAFKVAGVSDGIFDPDGKIKDRLAFAAGIQPVEVLSSLPTTDLYTGRTVVLTTNGKLHRYDGTAWTTKVDKDDLTVGSVVAGKIAAGAVNASDIIVNGVIKSDHLEATTLAAIKADIGDIRAGILRSAANPNRVYFNLNAGTASGDIVLHIGDTLGNTSFNVRGDGTIWIGDSTIDINGNGTFNNVTVKGEIQLDAQYNTTQRIRFLNNGTEYAKTIGTLTGDGRGVVQTTITGTTAAREFFSFGDGTAGIYDYAKQITIYADNALYLRSGSLSFFNVTPVGQQSAPNNLLSEVLAALRAYGLLAP